MKACCEWVAGGGRVNPDRRIDALKGSLCLVAGTEPGEFHTPPQAIGCSDQWHNQWLTPVGYL